ncbi:MAG: Mur ligase family protein [bacterium]|nr:Mur ligase family protein [bacterium]
MKNVSAPIKKSTTKDLVVPGRQFSYNEVVEYLDQNWTTNQGDTALSVMKKLDQAFGNVSQKLNTILITGTNGKSLTTNFTVKLLREENLVVGSFYSPHILTYNERFALNSDIIANKTFTDLANEVINTAQTLDLKANSFELLTMMALLYFKNNNVDVAVLEVSKSGVADATTICNPKLVAITRITEQNTQITEEENKAIITKVLGIVKPNTQVVSADQSKLNLQIMQEITEKQGGVWSMPIRKLAPLQYPFEQLHGRCAALAERIAYIFVNTFANKNALVVANSLLTKQKGQRGRPTLEAKRQSELNPKKTVDQFWKEILATLPGRFQLLDKEKPTILLDNASNLDAFANVLLGIRLLHYQRPLKGLTVVLGFNNPNLDLTEFLKLLRYFFKKTSGQVIVSPVAPMPGHTVTTWDVEKVTNDIKSMKIKAKSAKNFKEAFEAAQKSVDERHGLVVITGSPSIVTEYWLYKGIKKI